MLRHKRGDDASGRFSALGMVIEEWRPCSSSPRWCVRSSAPKVHVEVD